MINIIAEIAQAHEGSLGIAHSYIDALADAGVDAVKFQTHIADAESSPYESFRIKFSYEDNTRYDYWRRMEFTAEQWLGLKKHCEDRGVEFISSPFSCAAVDLLEKIGVQRYKIASGEVNNLLMLHRIGQTRKPVILSSGMSNMAELERAVGFLQSFASPLSVLQCTTAYPTPPEQWGLHMIKILRQKFGVPVGFSDHSADMAACLAAAALGAEILEFHAVFDRRMFGPDSKASLTIDEIRDLVKGVRNIEKSLRADYDKNDTAHFESLKAMFGKSLCVNKNLSAGHIITVEDLESKKPAKQGIDAADFLKVVGMKLNKNLNRWDFIRWEYLTDE